MTVERVGIGTAGFAGNKQVSADKINKIINGVQGTNGMPNCQKRVKRCNLKTNK